MRWGVRCGAAAAVYRAPRAQWPCEARACGSASRPRNPRPRPRSLPFPRPRQSRAPRPPPFRRPLVSIKRTRRAHSHAVTTRPRSPVHSADTRLTLPYIPQYTFVNNPVKYKIVKTVTMADCDWGYTCENGPATWVERYPEARGARQSPVDIDTTLASSGGCAPNLLWRYSVNHPRSVVNPGYCWRVDENGYDSEIRGGPLGSDVYKLQQWHCHWGAVNGVGSEHTVDGRSFSGELHLVHWNTTKYRSFTEAAGQPDGLAVLGVLLMVGKKHDELDKVIRLLPYIQHKGDKVTMSDPLDPAKLLPPQVAYWTYPGSLTTPPCTESVTWILFKQPVQVSAEQLALMRKLKCGEASSGVEAMELLHNYRPTLPLGNRELRDYGGN